MGLPSNRNLEFVGITVQDSGHLIFKSHYGVVEDQWIVTVRYLVSITLDCDRKI